MTTTPNPELQPFDAFVGEWTIEAKHRLLPGVVVRGDTVFEWLAGEKFLIQRSTMEHPDFPDGIAIIGMFGDGLAMHSFDSRGVYRVLEASFDDGVWRLWRDASPPDFSQRFAGSFADGGDTIQGVFQIAHADGRWEDDMEITYRRR